ncbi:hypothetical protein [Microbacterium sp. p3-SID336]|uniref:hypothetical protein n=1 Tax=Microbacterium sp. p3-SID336 TaxID=2916212 RepID=UPI0021A47FD6|nr:hypothetical protein [Microbacterium sp. p3-SID336]MCT1479306.1 hypothetical protein [Microbacterium sp. p3-SID336]
MTNPPVVETDLIAAHEAKLKELVERAASAGIEAETRVLERLPADRARSYLRLLMPNGRTTRSIAVFPRDVDAFLASGFEDYIMLSDYSATVSKSRGIIECQVIGASPSIRLASFLQELPGVEILSGETDGETETEISGEAAGGARREPSTDWRLVVEQDGVRIDISPASADFEMFFGRAVTLKLSGVATSNHDTAVEALERYGQALLFDLDVVYNRFVQLGKRRQGNRPRRHEQPDHRPRFPRNEYASQPLDLYQYGRAAAGLPLLEYLAYYQCVEYFFPFFAREQIVNSVKSQLLHPGFDAQNDAALNRLINLAAPAARGGMAEREQLRATLRSIVSEADLREFLESTPEYVDHFCSKSQSIRGVGTVQLDHNPADLRDQIADRIYGIRCRIVHAKQDGGGKSEDVLLPSSKEANSLQADVELMRLVAQRALIARAARA